MTLFADLIYQLQRGMNRFIKSFGYAFSGIKYAFRTQTNFKVHTFLFLLVVLAGWYFDLSEPEWIWVVVVSGLVFVTELANTALEAVVDLISPEYHEKAKIAKDVAAACVLLAAISAMAIGLIIFIPKIF